MLSGLDFIKCNYYMYSELIVGERLEAASLELGWMPEYHSVEEIDSFNKSLKRLDKYDGEGNKLFDWTGLSNKEKRFIQNEQSLVVCDAAYYLTRYAYIKDEESVTHRFQFRIPQKILFSIISELEERRAAIEIILLKARQLGCSTLMELLLSHRVPFHHGVNAVIASSSREQSRKMAKMFFRAFDSLPPWLKPNVTHRVESDQGMLEFGQVDSGISIQHGNQVNGIARGDTPVVYHLSEIAGFTDALNQIEASMFRAIHASPSVFGVLESTAEGDSGWWADTWKDSKEKYPKGRARLCPLFLPWFCGVDLYPKPTWIRSFPVPGGWRPSKETASHVASSELYVRSQPLLSKYMSDTSWGKQLRMPMEQQWWWEFHYEEAKRKKSEATFFQELCSNDIEAFQSSFDSVFGRDVINIVKRNRDRKYDVYGICGEQIEAKHEPDPDDIDYTRDRIPVSHTSHKGVVYRWEFVPLKWEDNDGDILEMDPTTKLFIFRHPQPGVDYSCGVDTSNGIGNDSTVAAMAARGGPEVPDFQVAEFRSNLVSHVEAHAFVLPLCAYYSKHMPTTTRFREPYVSVEQIAAVGDTCNLQMKLMGYSRFHQFVRLDDKKIRKQKARKQGWYTNSWSRPFVTDNFVVAVQNGWYIVNSPYTIDEMEHWETHYTAGGKEKKEHSEDSTDDGIFANGMAYFCPNDIKLLAERSKRRFAPVDTSQLPPLDIRAYGTTVKTSVIITDQRYSGELEDYK